MTDNNYPDVDSMIAAIRGLRLEVGALREASGRSHVEPQVSLPSKFDGSRERCRDFINQVKLIFRLQPSRYPDDRTKVGFIGTLLTGTAAAWFSPHFEGDSACMDDWELFVQEFEEAFGDMDRVSVAANKIRLLRQGTNTVSEYAAAFRRLICDLNWGDGAYVDQFRRGLRDDVKDLMLTVEIPKSLVEAIRTAVACDNRLMERKSDRRNAPHYNHYQHTHQRTNNGPVPMELDAIQQSSRRRGPLSPEERERRRRLNLCLYCGDAGHNVSECRVKPPRAGNFQVRP